jgi:membrane protease YdiL (CAAX protease family)
MFEVRLIDVVASLAGVALVCAPYLWCRAKGESPVSYGLSWSVSRRSLVECAVVTVVILAALSVVAMNWPDETLPRQSSLRRTVVMAINGVSAAIIEEIFFRGWIQPLARKKWGPAASIVCASAVFAAAHVFVARAAFIVAVFFPGCVMGMLRERHGNVATATLFHATANLWAIWFVPSHFPALKELISTMGF